MKDFGYEDEKDYGNLYSDEMGETGRGGDDGRHSMLGHVIQMLRSLLGILDILSENLENVFKGEK